VAAERDEDGGLGLRDPAGRDAQGELDELVLLALEHEVVHVQEHEHRRGRYPFVAVDEGAALRQV
jgi:hypothetical protein